MLELPGLEIAIFAFVVVVYLAAAIVGIVELLAGGEKYKRFLLPLVSLVVTLEAVILILRTIAIKTVPLTGLFESMIVLTIVFGLIHLFFSIAIRQVWFGSVMGWVILPMVSVSDRLLLLKGKVRAYIAIIVFVLVRFAIVGVAILGATQHDFSLCDQPVSPVVTYV